MIQDISPDKLNNTFAVRSPGPDDNILLFDDGGKLCVRIRDGEICFTTGKHVSLKEAVYLFSVNETAFFLSAQSATAAPPGFEYRTIRELRELGHGRDVFAAFTAYHLWRWYADNRF
ncbi:MAG: NAD(+) diphosphatase, partial [Clostridiales bacterium]|nr:NAD(+) diphosphatase [Clostridiales bacterium]